MTESIACHKVETEIKALFKLSTQTITMTTINVLQVNNWISIVLSCCAIKSVSIVLITLIIGRLWSFNAINCIDIAIWLKCNVVEPNSIQLARIKSFESHLNAIRQLLLPSKVCTECLWKFEMTINCYDIWIYTTCIAIGCTNLIRCLSTISQEGWRKRTCRIWANINTAHLHTCICPCILNPYKWCTAIEDADATTQ